ncbi:MAG: glycosyl hydrolase family 28-related protein [Candidatus Acidiferrales bacterium]
MDKYDIRAFGAVGDGKTDDTAAIQEALNAAANNGGGIVYVPKGEYRVGRLIFPRDGGHWVVVMLDGSLYLTQTLQMNRRAYAIIGRTGAVFTPFQQEPSAQIFFDPSVDPIIHVTANPVYLEGLTMKYMSGDGILATDGSVDLVLKRIFIDCGGFTTGCVPLRAENSQNSFGLYVDQSTLLAGQAPGAHSIVLKNYSAVSISNSMLGEGGIYVSGPNSPESAGYDFQHVLYEGGHDPFLQIDNTGGYFAGIDLRFVEMADPNVWPDYLIDNSGAGTTRDVSMKFIHGQWAKLVTGNSPILGLQAMPASTTAEGSMSFLGQSDFYEYFDNQGQFNIARLVVGAGGTAITRHLSLSVSLAFPPVAPGQQQELETSLAGAQTDDSCDVSPDASVEPGLMWSCYVPVKDTVAVRLINASASVVAPAQRNWRINIWEH